MSFHEIADILTIMILVVLLVASLFILVIVWRMHRNRK